MTVINHSCINR